MLNWINDNSGALNFLTNIGMLGIWGFYLQLFLVSYRRQRKAKIIVNRGAGNGIDAHCLVSNMSAQAVYMQSILVTVRAADGSWTGAITNVDSDEGTESDIVARRGQRQGPLEAGAFVDLGPYEKLMYQGLAHALGDHDSMPRVDDIRTIEIIILAIYGSEDLMVGARRRFDIDRGRGMVPQLKPCSISTEQLGGRRHRRWLEGLMRDTDTL